MAIPEGLRFVKVQAYHPRAREMNAGGCHIVPTEAFQIGRLSRKRWQPLCTTRRFWELLTTDHDVDCRRCQAVYDRLQPSPPVPAPS